MKRNLPIIGALVLLALIVGVILLGGVGESKSAKPVIYLYPEEETRVSVKLDYDGTLTSTYPAYGDGWTVDASPDGTLTSTYPAYGDGWTVDASPDGTLTDPITGRQYYCLFWEGVTDRQYDFSQGFCVAREDTAAFLEEALAELGLTEREANEFIIYWLPRLEENPYNLISFQTTAYTDGAELTIDPAPDTLIRVFMAWRGLEEPVEVAPQTLTAPERTGFTAVEWGGAEVR